MCIRDSLQTGCTVPVAEGMIVKTDTKLVKETQEATLAFIPVSYTHLRAHETVLDLVCRLLLEKKQRTNTTNDV